MKVESLRIGNFVNYNNDLKMVEGIILTARGYRVSMGIVDAPIQMIDPVFLKEKILLQYGFVKGEFGLSKKAMNTTVNLYWICGGYFYVVGKPREDNYTIKECEHLHTLQNLWYALTGEELELEHENDHFTHTGA